jgi:hypothetical protein
MGRVLMTAVMASALLGCTTALSPQQAEASQNAAAARLLVKPRAGVSPEQLDSLLRPYGARRIERIQQINVYVFELSPDVDARALAQSLSKHPHIEFAEVDQRVPPSPKSDVRSFTR